MSGRIVDDALVDALERTLAAADEMLALLPADDRVHALRLPISDGLADALEALGGVRTRTAYRDKDGAFTIESVVLDRGPGLAKVDCDARARPCTAQERATLETSRQLPTREVYTGQTLEGRGEA